MNKIVNNSIKIVKIIFKLNIIKKYINIYKLICKIKNIYITICILYS
jgi:hypothetical protein